MSHGKKGAVLLHLLINLLLVALLPLPHAQCPRLTEVLGRLGVENLQLFNLLLLPCLLVVRPVCVFFGCKRDGRLNTQKLLCSRFKSLLAQRLH